MRLLAIHLRHYRGIADRRIEFPDTGVTVVEGPNETGKSSLAEALDLVLSEFDSTKKQRWLAVKPVNVDAAPEIEVEVSTGPYRFTYFKRFFKKPETRLTVHSPKPEQLAGREAHERVEKILEETIDGHLFRALRVQQGAGIDQPGSLVQSPSLVQALDATAGEDPTGDKELDLFELVHTEYARYWTERGQQRKAIKLAYEAEEQAAAGVHDLEQDLARLESDIERLESLERSIVGSEKERGDAESNVACWEQKLKALADHKSELNARELAYKTSTLQASGARRELRVRTDLVERVRQARREKGQLEARATGEEPELLAAKRRADEQQTRLKAAVDRIKDAERLSDLRDHDMKFRDSEHNLGQFEKRHGRIETAEKQRAAARETLDSIKVDDAALAELREGAIELERARALLDANSPRIKVHALGAIEADLDGDRVCLEEGGTIHRAVAGETVLSIPGAVEITVTAGTSVEELVQRRDQARQKLERRLAEAGAATVADAEAQNERRKEARRIRTESEEAIADALDDLSYDKLREKLERTRNRVEHYLESRSQEPAIAPDFDSAWKAKIDARGGLEEARREAEEAEAGFTVVNEAWQQRQQALAETRLRVRLAAESLHREQAKLETARAEAPDGGLEDRTRVAEQRLREAESAYATARREYESREPGRATELRDNARRAAAGAQTRLDDAREQRHTLAGRLEAHGEDGLFERLEEARTRHRHTRRARRGLERRAAAAGKLYETMRDAREREQRTYVLPLRDGIMDLGKLVFGESFSVELDEELKVEQRTLDGITLPYSSLSMGAQEQIGLLSRVACAMVIDREQGVPLIFDDTLGYADPDRLEGMGAMLSKAGEKTQIILLTCTPDRFRHVGGAHVVRLPK